MSLIVVLRNVSPRDGEEVCDYEYQVLVGDGTAERSRTITTGMVRTHQRSDGWLVLVQRLLDLERERQ